MWEVRGPKMVEDEYEPGIRLSLFEKDLRIISSFARDSGSPAPLLAESVRLYEQALVAGDGELDSAVVFRRYMQMGDDGR
jgi:L-threonate 2-dehydrogenase